MKNGNDWANPSITEDSCGNPTKQNHGLTKRELFAAMAMQGELARSYCGEQEPPADLIPGWAVKMADGLIAALNEATP